uniref:Uncharacterized protein n=1 Tax=Caenorhabditis japonica TaxID=281687 RepID=A0A8R1HVL4_CAEJA
MTNIRRIHQFIYVTVPFSHVSFIVQKVLIVGGLEEAFICLPAYAVERSFATYFHHDYEGKNRSYIAYIIGILTYLISFASAFLCLRYSVTFYPFLALLVINILSYLINIANYRLNHYYYKCSLRKIYTYSLTERYQLSENIQFAKLFHNFALVISLFATTCSFLLLLASFPFTAAEKNVFLAIFDALFLIFIIYTPYIHYKYNATWQHEFKKCMKLYTSGVQCSSVANGKPSLHLKTTFGKQMPVSRSGQTDLYFSQLGNSWNNRKPESS